MNLFPTAELMTEYWSNLNAKKKYPIDSRNVQARSNAEFHRSSVIKLFVLQIDRGGQNALLYIAGV